MNPFSPWDGFENLPRIIKECEDWTEAFKFGDNPHNLSDDEVFAVAIYTHELKGSMEGNFYFQLNQMLRKRSKVEFDKWRGYLYFLKNALRKFPDQKETVYRGFPFTDIIEKEYREKRPIYWSGFSSCTPKFDVAKDFAKGPGGILLRIKIFSGKLIKEYSIISMEDEILLLPNTKFRVTKGIQKEGEYFYVDLEEQENPFIF